MNNLPATGILTRPKFLLCLLLAFTATVYSFGLPGIFILDDNGIIQNNRYIQIDSLDTESVYQATFAKKRWPFYRATGMFSFALHYVTGYTNPEHFKIINISIHLFNGVLVYIFMTLVLGYVNRNQDKASHSSNITIPALVIVAIWLLHPIQVSTVLYPYQRVTQLSALFVLSGIIFYLYYRIASIKENKSILVPIVGSGFFTLLAMLSKENGALLPLYLLCIELFILKFYCLSKLQTNLLRAFFIIFVVIPLTIATVYYTNPDYVSRAYAHREFTLFERLMTESRVLWLYLDMFLWPDISKMSLYHDNFTISKSLLSPLTTITSIAGILILTIFIFLARKNYPLISFGIFFWLFSHFMESTFLSLELIYEHRNYIGLVGLSFALYSLIYNFINFVYVKRAIYILILLVISTSTTIRAKYWSDEESFFKHESINQPDSSRAKRMLAAYYIKALETDLALNQEYYPKIFELLNQAIEDDINAVWPLAQLIVLNDKLDMKIDNIWYEMIESRLGSKPGYHEKLFALRYLATCHVTVCDQNTSIVKSIFEMTIDNNHFTDALDSRLYAYYAMFLEGALDEIDEANDYLNKALEIKPDSVTYNLNLVYIKYKLGEVENAKYLLNRTKALDKYDLYSIQIKQLSSMLLK